ncbi:RNA ligase/cyclic nucleotide phosphodiesterase [Mycena amicta]|nr:RNA ligase/cyclic nucleotide phosphodiesterase [Mycena amicta]
MGVRPEAATTDKSYPHFIPHITLAALPNDPEPTLEQIQAAIPALPRSLDVSFDRVEVGDHYFRSVYLVVQPTPDLIALHQHVHKALGITNPRTPKFPHLSLCYISDNDAAAGERTRYYDAISERIRHVGDGISLNTEGEDWLSLLSSLAICIARCDGPVDTWTVEKRIPINSLA